MVIYLYRGFVVGFCMKKAFLLPIFILAVSLFDWVHTTDLLVECQMNEFIKGYGCVEQIEQRKDILDIYAFLQSADKNKQPVLSDAKSCLLWLKQLNVLAGPLGNMQSSLVHVLCEKSGNPNVSACERIMLASMLACTVSSKEKLVERQNAIRELQTNEKTEKEINGLLEIVRVAEPALIKLYRNSQAPERLKDPLSPFFNNHEHAKLLLDYSGTAILLGSFGYYLFSFVALCKLIKSVDNKAKVNTVVAHITGLVSTGGVTVSLPFVMYRIYNEFKMYRNIQEELIKLAQMIKAYEQIKEVIEKDRSTVLTQVVFPNLQTKQFQRLSALLHTSTFAGNASIFSHVGRVASAAAQVSKCQSELGAILTVIGKLGALKVVADIVSKEKNSCFVEFKEGRCASIDLQNVSNPFLDSEKAVPNSLVLGDKKPKVLILTGSNTGGKSTFERAVGLAVHLGHTAGFTFAQKAVMSLFKRFGASLTVTDDVSQGESLYQAEINSLKNVREVASQATEAEKAVVLIDEPLKGTGAEKGAGLAKRFTQELANKSKNASQNVVGIVATHYRTVTELGKEDPNTFVNGRLDVKKDEQGSITRPFVFEIDKVSENNIAEEMAQEIFGD